MANCRMWIVCGVCSPPEIQWDDEKEFGGIPWRAQIPEHGLDNMAFPLAKWFPGTPYYAAPSPERLEAWLEHHSHGREEWGPDGDGPDHFRIEYA